MAAAGLHEGVLAHLGAEIADGRFTAGDVIRLDQIERRFGVSRTVAREAIKMLESLNLVESRRRVGIVVRPPGDWDVFSPRVIRWRLAGEQEMNQLRSLAQLRTGIEPMAAALAATHAAAAQCATLTGAVMGMTASAHEGDREAYLRHDIDFHRALLAASGNEMVAALHQVVEEVLIGRARHPLTGPPAPATIARHRDVADAVATRNSVAAAEAMSRIVSEACDAVETMAAQSAVESVTAAD